MIELPRGTIEHLIVDVSDRLKNITTLTGMGTTYSIRRKGETTYIVEDAVATTVGMSAYCLLDSTSMDYDESGVFQLFLTFDNFPELPILGPFEFEVNNL